LIVVSQREQWNVGGNRYIGERFAQQDSENNDRADLTLVSVSAHGMLQRQSIPADTPRPATAETSPESVHEVVFLLDYTSLIKQQPYGHCTIETDKLYNDNRWSMYQSTHALLRVLLTVGAIYLKAATTRCKHVEPCWLPSILVEPTFQASGKASPSPANVSSTDQGCRTNICAAAINDPQTYAMCLFFVCSAASAMLNTPSKSASAAFAHQPVRSVCLRCIKAPQVLGHTATVRTLARDQYESIAIILMRSADSCRR
jgi:hypothetical protein